ncbi:putative hydrolase of the metallo-beta-lactamase superfamily%2C clustered with KDO2-Lipid A biosynthesis genes [Yersinia kristensenii]|nr:putative hydrolase of the metallo-beta-lactamase superfamily%2C clustered with KDO2-Lipid A biosynthesis genes [Yersinia kristensenii]
MIGVLLALGALLWVSGNIYCQYLTLALMSFVWGCWHGDKMLMQIEQFTQGDQQIVATINNSHLVWVEGNKVLLDIQQVNGKKVFPAIKVTVKWQEGLDYCAGQQWQFWLRMRSVHSLLNEGGG